MTRRLVRYTCIGALYALMGLGLVVVMVVEVLVTFGNWVDGVEYPDA